MKKLFYKTFCIILLFTGSTVKAQSFINYTTADGLPDNFITGGVAVDSNNNKWFGTAAGVAKYDNTSWTVYDTADGLIDNYTKCIAVDKNNNVWVGTDNGVSKFDGTTWTSYTVADSLIDNGVVHIAGDIDGSIWFATTVGVSKFDGSTWTNYTTTNGLPTDVINYIATDLSGQKWFGTQLHGVSVYDNSTFTNISTTTMDSLVDNDVYAIAVNKSGQKWIGTRNGITKLDIANNWLTNYRPINGLYNEWVHDIKIDSNNNVWVALFTDYNYDGGISVFNGTAWHSYSIADGLADKMVIRLAIDKNNDVWIATGNGVSKFTNTIGINTIQEETNFNVYPNPATDVVYINHSNSEILVNIFDVTAKLIKSIALTPNESEVNIDDFDPGVYILQFNNDNNSKSTKLIKL
jgi:ligand-binding sensor domain-containing protein